MWTLLLTIALLAVLCVVIVVLVRRQLTPPVEVAIGANGLHLDVHRAPLRDVSITIEDGTTVEIEELASGTTTLPWNRFGLSADDAAPPDVNDLVITARANQRWFRTSITFGDAGQNEYVSQVWNYIDKPPPPTAPPKTATAAPDNP